MDQTKCFLLLARTRRSSQSNIALIVMIPGSWNPQATLLQLPISRQELQIGANAMICSNNQINRYSGWVLSHYCSPLQISGINQGLRLQVSRCYREMIRLIKDVPLSAGEKHFCRAGTVSWNISIK